MTRTVTREQALEARGALASTTCFCGKKKTRGHVFCRGCYWRLPAEVQKALYRDAYSPAYVEAYVAAVERLKPAAGAAEIEDGRLF